MRTLSMSLLKVDIRLREMVVDNSTLVVVGAHLFGDDPNDPNAALRSMMSDGGDHYSHYDLLCGVNAPRRVFPVVSEFLERIEVLNGLFRL